MSIGGVSKSPSWLDVDQAWNQSRAAISQQFLDLSSTLSDALSSAVSNQVQGAATLAGEAALKRVQDAAAAKNGQSSSQIAAADLAANTAPPPNPAATAKSSSNSSSSSSSSSASSSSSSSASSSGAPTQGYTYTSAAAILSVNPNVLNLFT